jgi:uncharacterized membrane protein
MRYISKETTLEITFEAPELQQSCITADGHLTRFHAWQSSLLFTVIFVSHALPDHHFFQLNRPSAHSPDILLVEYPLVAYTVD